MKLPLFSFFGFLAAALTACSGSSRPPVGTEPADFGPAPDRGGAVSPDTYFANPTVHLPADGVDNANGTIGPFCCTGRTATIKAAAGGAPVGYVYFFDFREGYNVGNTSVADWLGVEVSGADNLNAGAAATQITGVVGFSASDMAVGKQQSARVGALEYTVTIEHADISTPIDGKQPYFDMGTIAVRVDVARAQ